MRVTLDLAVNLQFGYQGSYSFFQAIYRSRSSEICSFCWIIFFFLAEKALYFFWALGWNEIYINLSQPLNGTYYVIW